MQLPDQVETFYSYPHLFHLSLRHHYQEVLPSDPTARVQALEQTLFPTDFLGSTVERENAVPQG